MKATDADGKPVRRVYNDSRITITTTTPDGRTVSAKSTGVDSSGKHFLKPSDYQRLDFKATGKVKFSLKEGLGLDYAQADKKGKTDILTKEPSDATINRIAAENKASYEAKKQEKLKQRREKSKQRTRKKLKTIKGAGGTSDDDGVVKIDMGPRLVKKRGGAIMKARGGTFKGIF
jgi:hypothetical protein|tara:strand:+ start:3616 stop:4140 length:525 start_codon:yes stop_codon:yes gene_type:complete